MISISIIVPVYNGGEQLRTCLEKISSSAWKPAELIVVDDGSTDDSREMAASFGAKVLSTDGRRGPAYARNLGASAATGDLLFFLDADVAVHGDTIARVAAAFESEPDIDALVGSYDDSPASPDFISQYKNLMHHFVHQGGRQQAFTFWSGCGAIRRDVFRRHSGFDESYGRPAIEDIELGYRLLRAKCRIVLDRDVQVKHLKRWTLFNLVKTDVLDRGIPWTELILQDRRMPNDLNLQVSQRVSVALVFLLVGIAAAAAIYWRGYFLVPVFALLFFLLGRYWVEGTGEADSKDGTWYMLGSAGLLVWLSYTHQMMGLIPPLLLASLLLVMRHRWAVPGVRRKRVAGLSYAGILAVSVVTTLIYLPANFLVFLFFSTVILVVVLNTNFYLFLAAKRGKLFALAALPFHLLFLFYSGISFLIGIVRFAGRTLVGRKTVAARPRPLS